MYPLDDNLIDIGLTVAGYEVIHRLKRPTFAQLVERDSRIKHEEVTVNEGQVELSYTSDAANLALWPQIIQEVKGYDLGDGNLGWRVADEQLKGLMPAEHKQKAIEALVSVSGEIVDPPNGAGFRLIGQAETGVLIPFGDGLDVKHVLRNPSESEWATYRRTAFKIIQVRGSKKQHLLMHSNLSAEVALYDSLLVRLEGVTLNGEEFNPDQRERFIQAMDPIQKREVIKQFSQHWNVETKTFTKPL